MRCFLVRYFVEALAVLKWDESVRRVTPATVKKLIAFSQLRNVRSFEKKNFALYVKKNKDLLQ